MPTTTMDRREQLLAEVSLRREVLRKEVDSPVGDEALLRRQLDWVEQVIYAGRCPDAEWDEHQLHWMAHQAEVERALICRSARLMLALEDMERQDADVFIYDATVLELLHWWREEGGRNDYLGQITISERRELEEQERRWRDKRP